MDISSIDTVKDAQALIGLIARTEGGDEQVKSAARLAFSMLQGAIEASERASEGRCDEPRQVSA